MSYTYYKKYINIFDIFVSIKKSSKLFLTLFQNGVFLKKKHFKIQIYFKIYQHKILERMV